MKVKIQKLHINKPTKFGTVKKLHGHGRVMVDAEQGDGWQHAGWVPLNDDDPFKGVFHPISGFPQELCDVVVQASDQLTRSLKAPPGRAAVLEEDAEEEEQETSETT